MLFFFKLLLNFFKKIYTMFLDTLKKLVFFVFKNVVGFFDWVLGCFFSGLFFIFLCFLFTVFYNYIWIKYLLTSYPLDFVLIHIIWLFYP